MKLNDNEENNIIQIKNCNDCSNHKLEIKALKQRIEKLEEILSTKLHLVLEKVDEVEEKSKLLKDCNDL